MDPTSIELINTLDMDTNTGGTPNVSADVPKPTERAVETLQEQVARLMKEKEAMEKEFFRELDARVEKEREVFVNGLAKVMAYPKKIDVAKPEDYDGAQSKLPDFLQQLHLVFRANPKLYSSDTERCHA